MGRPDDALGIAREAVELGFAHNGVSLCVALALSAIPVALCCGQHALARIWTGVLCEHAARHGLLYWHGWGSGYQAALDGSGQAGATAAWPLQVDVMATLFDAAASGEALRRARTGESPWSAPEVLRRWQGLPTGDAEGLELVRRLLDEALLLPVHGRYTQGHASVDVMAAAALLAELA